MLDIQLNINPDGIEKSIGELQNKLNKAFSGKGFANLDNQAKMTTVHLNDVASKLAQVTQRMKDLENQKIPTQEYVEVQKQITETQAKLVKLQEHFDKMKEAGKPLEGIQLKKFQYDVAELTNTLEYAKGELKDLEDTGKAFTMGNTTPEFEKLALKQRDLYNSSVMLQEKLGKSTGIFDTLGQKLKKLGGNVFNTVISGFKKLGKSAQEAGQKMHSAFNFKNILKYALGLASLRTVFNKLRAAIKEGMNNLAQFNGGNNETNKSLSMLTSSLLQLKNSLATAFAPILNFIAPALNTLIQLLSQAATALGIFFAKLTGQSTFTKAVAVQKDYAKSLNATGKAASKTKDKLAAFDDLQVLNPDQGDSGGGGAEVSPQQMFEEIPIDEYQGKLLDFFAPFKESWDTYGAMVLDSWLWAGESIMNLAKSIGDSFMEVWTNGTGELFLNNILQIVSNIGLIVGNLANGFRIAWETNNIGTSIIQGIFNIFNAILGTLNTITAETVKWSATLNFYPILEAIDEILKAILHALQPVLDLAEYLWVNVVLPIGSFILEQLIPILGQLVADCLNVIGDFLEWIEPKLEWLMENVVNPIAGAIGEGVIMILTSLHELLSGPLRDALNTVYKVIDTFIWPILQIIAKWLKTTIVLIIDDLMDFIDVAIKTISSWVEGFKQFFDGVVKFFTSLIHGDIQGALDGLVGMFKGAFNMIISIVEGALNFVIRAINNLIDAINSVSFDIPDWVPGIGGGKFGFNLSHVNEFKLPRLAEGAVIPPNREFAAVLGDQKSGVNIETPLDTMVQAFKTAMAETTQTAVGATMELDGQTFAQLIVPYVMNEFNRQGYDVNVITGG